MKEDKGRTPLRIILNNFLNHIEKLESHRSPEDSYEKEFQDLKLFSENLKGLKQYASTEGEKEANRKKNRYKDILPFDFSRVILSEYAGTAGSDYINANFIKGASGSPAYIASQGPLPHTVNDFWRMVVECEVHVIIMACNQDEAGKHKCEKYWVEREGEVKQFGMVRIRLLQGSSVCPDFSVRTIKLEYTNKDNTTEERTVCQFHYSAWPDHGVPPSVRPLLDMVRLVRDTQASETLPVLVHCSAGCGRTGTICAIDYVWGLLRAGKLTKDFSLLSLVREMRRQRVAMVQTTEQYVLVHRAVRELFREQLRVIDSHPYENIDLNGTLLHSKGEEEPVYESIHTADKPQIADEVPKAGDTTPAPPLPRKNRVHMAASKHEKEVENQTQKQRGNQSGPGGIAKLKAMFERSPVSRSQSLGRRQASNPTPATLPDASKSPPALPIKRSKSLRILGSGERSKLSLAAQQENSVATTNHATSPEKTNHSKPPVKKGKGGALVRRRRSFDSNDSPKPMRRSLHLDEDGRRLLQDCKDFLAGSLEPPLDSQQRIDNIVAGLGVRERRDSFRQAVSKKAEPQHNDSASGGPPQQVHRSRAPLRNPDTDEVDGRTHIQQSRRDEMDVDEVDCGFSNVIVVKPDRASPKPELYVKSLPGDVLSGKDPSVKQCDQPKQISRLWRAATSIDLKSNLRNNDLTLQELKSCLRREGTAHELKLRKDQNSETATHAVKPYKSLDRMPKREEQSNNPHPTHHVIADRRNFMAVGTFAGFVSPHHSPQTTVDRKNPLNSPSSPHCSPQTTVDRMNPMHAQSSPHQSPQTTVDRRNPMNATSSPHHSPQTTVDRRNPLTATSSPHHSPQTTVDRRNPLNASHSPHHSPQTTVDRRNPFSAASSPQQSPQTTVDRRNPLNSQASPHHSPQTTVDRRNPLNQPSSPHRSPQTTVDRRNALNTPTSPHQSPQTTVDRRNPMNHSSPQATVDRHIPMHAPPSPHRSPQTTVDRRNPAAQVPVQMPQMSMLMGHAPVVSSMGNLAQSSGSHQMPGTSGSQNRPLVPADHRTSVASPAHRPTQMLVSPHRSRQTPAGPGPATFDKQHSEPYSYGLVASVLLRGSQDDLALCSSGATGGSPKLSLNAQRPSAPPRIKRHASVVLPRKNAASKGHTVTVKTNSHNLSDTVSAPDQLGLSMASPSASSTTGSSVPPGPALPSHQTAQSASSNPATSSSVASENTNKPRNSPKKSAGSSLSRALGALQLRRSQTASSVNSSRTTSPPVNQATTVTTSVAPTLVNSSSVSHNSSTTMKPPPGSVPPSSLAPTLVVTPSKPAMPPGIIDEITSTTTPSTPTQQHFPHLLRGPAHFMQGPRRHPHPLPHTNPLQLHQHRHPFSTHSTHRLPVHHRHPHSPQHYPVPPQQPPVIHHVYPQHPVQHPKTHKKQQYL